MSHFRQIFYEEYERRKKKNEKYSLRAYSKFLGINSGTLSQVLANKRALSFEKQKKLLSRLGRVEAIEKYNTETSEVSQVEVDSFAFVSDPLYFSVLELFELSSFRQDIVWMAQKLGVSTFEISVAIQRLVRVGLLGQKGDRLYLTRKNLSTLHIHDSNDALRTFQARILEQSIWALENVSPEQRSQSCLTVALPKSALPKLKQKITDFRRELNEWLSHQKAKDEVYHLSISLIPTRKKD